MSLESAAAWFQSLAQCSGLRICCCCSFGSNSIPDLGTSTCPECRKGGRREGRKERKKERRENKLKEDSVPGLGTSICCECSHKERKEGGRKKKKEKKRNLKKKKRLLKGLEPSRYSVNIRLISSFLYFSFTASLLIDKKKIVSELSRLKSTYIFIYILDRWESG